VSTGWLSISLTSSSLEANLVKVSLVQSDIICGHFIVISQWCVGILRSTLAPSWKISNLKKICLSQYKVQFYNKFSISTYAIIIFISILDPLCNHFRSPTNICLSISIITVLQFLDPYLITSLIHLANSVIYLFLSVWEIIITYIIIDGRWQW